jgi:FKBP-type peptidyl-prolyl cis-trans isomerase
MRFCLGFITFFFLSFAACSRTPHLDTPSKKMSYAMGQQIGSGLSTSDLAIDHEILIRGVEDALARKKSLMTDAEMNEAVQMIHTTMTDAQKKKEDVELKTTEAYLAENAQKPGVVKTSSGLEYEVLKAGSGEKPRPSDGVIMHYSAYLPDGSKFDSSVDRQTPVKMSLRDATPGIREGLLLMNTGAKFRLVMTSMQAFGPKGHPGVPGGAVVIYEIELLKLAP